MEWLHQVLLTVLIALVVMWIVKQWVTRPKNLPPGPRGLPFLGVAWTLMTYALKDDTSSQINSIKFCCAMGHVILA